MTEKKCTNCKQIKSTEHFTFAKDKRDPRGGYLKSNCKVCSNAYTLARFLKDPERARKLARERAKKNPERYKAKGRRAYLKRYKNNPEYFILKARISEGVRKQCIPKWLTSEHWIQISDTYQRRREISNTTGILHHVDHIIPLQGINVCGLHVPWNLQIITAKENWRKHNSMPLEFQ